jgi:hypothetical protein
MKEEKKVEDNINHGIKYSRLAEQKGTIEEDKGRSRRRTSKETARKSKNS